MRAGICTSALGIGGMLALSLWAWPQISNSQLMPIHWGLSGQPDGYANKTVGLLAMPILMSLVAVIFWVRIRMDPRQENLAESATAVLSTWCGVLALMLVVHAAIVFSALGNNVPVSQIVPVGVGILLLLVGATMGNLRPNHSFGVRTRWTLTSDQSWEKTNRLAAWLMCAMGLGTIASGLLNNMYMLLVVLLGGVAVLLPASLIYSYVVWKQDKTRHEQ